MWSPEEADRNNLESRIASWRKAWVPGAWPLLCVQPARHPLGLRNGESLLVIDVDDTPNPQENGRRLAATASALSTQK